MDYEKLVLSEIMIASKDKQLDYIGELGLQDFQTDKWNKLFRVINQIIYMGGQADLPTVYSKAKDIVEVSELTEMVTTTMSDGYISQHIKLLKEQRYKRQIVDAVKFILGEIETSDFLDNIEAGKNKLISELSAISLSNESTFMDWDKTRAMLFENMNKNHDIEGISWGVRALDTYTSGIIIPRLIVLGGLKKGGKSRFVINLIRNLSLQKVKTVFLSMEMPEYEITKLLHSTFTGIDDLKLRSNGFITGEEKARLKNTPIPKEYFDVECKSGLRVDEVVGRIRKYAKMGYKIIFVDYLQRISHNRNNQAQELEDICVKIADATRANNVSVILLSQLSNLAEREVPTTGHIKGSGGVAESADIILLFDNIYRRTKQDGDKNKVDIYIEQRYGDSGVIHLQSSLGTCSINDLAPDYSNIGE